LLRLVLNTSDFDSQPANLVSSLFKGYLVVQSGRFRHVYFRCFIKIVSKHSDIAKWAQLFFPVKKMYDAKGSKLKGMKTE